MLSFKYIRTNFEEIKKSLRARQDDLDIDGLRAEIDEYFSNLLELEKLRTKRNEYSDKIGSFKQENKDASSLMSEVKGISSLIKEEEKKLALFKKEIKDVVVTIPNLLDDRVVLGCDESENEVISHWGEIKQYSFKVLDHTEIAEKFGIIDYQRASKMTGSRFSYFRGKGARLHRALIQFFLDENTSRGYEEHFTPFIVNRQSLYTTGQLPKFEEDLFSLNNSNYCLIPTSEVSMTNFYRDEILKEETLPRRMTAFSSCFRGEAGAPGKYTKGTFRNHQFEKVELCCISHPNESEKEHEYMLKSVETILRKLKLPYRVVRLCSGDIGFSARMCYDLEVWIPSLEKYMEISSVSNCGDFQAERGKIRFKDKEGKNQLVHTLNGSSLAVGRALIAILENYQQEDGSVIIPEILQPYAGFSIIN